MIKVFDTKQKYLQYAKHGIRNGEVCYVREDHTIHLQTNKIDGYTCIYDFTSMDNVKIADDKMVELITIEVNEDGLYCADELNCFGFKNVIVNTENKR